MNILRHDWTLPEIEALYTLPLPELVFRAQSVHRAHHAPDQVQGCMLLSIKTGGCPEDCAYCPQSAHYKTGVDREGLLSVEDTLTAAGRAREQGATRFCMGAAWRDVPKDGRFDQVLEMVRGVRALGMEACCTLGMLNDEQARALADAGLSAYNHNLDTSAEFYGEIITTRTYQERLDTLARVRRAGVTVCCGGIIGMGESRLARYGLLRELSSLDPHPESVPVNMLVAVEGTPLGGRPPEDPLELVRMIATARILMPKSMVRLSAGRLSLSAEAQALCFLAGANSVFLGEKLLTTPNPESDADQRLFAKLGVKLMEAHAGTSPLESRVRAGLKQLSEDGLTRTLRAPRGIDLSSNDYLGLARHPCIVARMAQAIAEEGCGSTGSRLLRGERESFAAIERRFAAFKRTERSLYFSSGYLANLGVLTGLTEHGDTLYCDALNHASLIDGARLSRARRVVFPHNDVEALARSMQGDGGQKFVVVESLFSMEGDFAPLREYAALCRETGAALIVDEAHAVGIYGEHGSGLLEETGADAFLSVNTGGKALGVCGAFVAGPEWAIEFLLQKARTFIFSTAAPPAVAQALDASLDVIAGEPQRRHELLRLSSRLRDRLRGEGISVLPATSQILAVVLGENERALAAAQVMQDAGFDIRAIRPPTVPAGTARLRISVNVNLSDAELDRFVDTLQAALESSTCAASL